MDEKRTKIGVATAQTTVVMPSPTPAPSPSDPGGGGGVSGPGAKTSYLPAPPPAIDPLLGATLAGRYHIEKKLGEGGMGAVYLASHNVLEKHVALKVLHAEFARKPDLVERFMQEAKAASRIRHENVIDISDFGATSDGLVFFAMELLDGRDLHEEVARARLAGRLLPWARSKKIFLQICSALSAAHKRGIIHRDLKPENVYLVEFLGDSDFVKLLDFGIAKVTEVNEGDRKLTRTGMLFGTPEYMSPEQARGEHVDHRVDIYAMGCILFQLVTGRVPFESENFMGVLSLHLTEPPPTIPLEVFDRIGAPRELAGVIAHALEKDRERRFGSIDELANAVRAVCGDAPVIAGTGSMTAPNVVAPATTVQRTPTGQPLPPSQSGRVRTQWTGRLSVPEAEDAPPPRKSKLPLIIGAIVIAGGAIAATALVVSRNADPAAPGAPAAAAPAAIQPPAAPPTAPAGVPAATPPPPTPTPPTTSTPSTPTTSTPSTPTSTPSTPAAAATAETPPARTVEPTPERSPPKRGAPPRKQPGDKAGPASAPPPGPSGVPPPDDLEEPSLKPMPIAPPAGSGAGSGG